MRNIYRYTGQRNESDLGLMFYGSRYYDPALGRFAQADSVVPNPGNPQSLNRYSYTLNNPVRYNDPTGHCIGLLAFGCAGAAVAGTVDLAKQLIVDHKDIQHVDWAEVGGAAVGGFVAGATLGLAPAAASVPTLMILGGCWPGSRWPSPSSDAGSP